MIVKTAEPFFFPGNSTGCLLIHGFTGAPTEMRPLGDFLAEKGFTVLGVRLSAHGTNIADMRRTRWQDWSASVLDGWHLISSAAEDIFLIGLSMGGALALYHSSFLPVKGVVSMSAPHLIKKDPRIKLLPVLRTIFPYIKKGKSDWQDRNAAEAHFSYDKYPTNGVLELNKLLTVMRQSLPSINVPALLMHSKKDLGVLPENMDRIYNELGSEESLKQKIWLENSGHVITRDLDKEIVFQSISKFINMVLDPDK